MQPKVVKVWNGSAWVPVPAKSVKFEATGEIFTTSGSWQCPAGVTQVTVECWGAGGGGGGRTGTGAGGGAGGGGGAYSKNTIAVTPGNIYNFIVGLGGTASSGDGTDGGDTIWDDGLQIKAAGGKKGIGSVGGGGTVAGGLGGAVVDSVGSVKFKGGDGATGIDTSGGRSGGGGGGAGSTGNGGDAPSHVGGTGTVEFGGNGGTGLGAGSGESNGAPGFVVGGAGSGARRNNTGSAVGGAGARGQIRVTEFKPEQDPVKVHDYLLEEIFTSSGSWTAPEGITEVQVECWGAGGGGGGMSGSPRGSAGGGGGAYARKKVTVIPGNNYPYIVGAAGLAGSSSGGNGGDGGDSFWDSGTEVKAEGGKGGEGQHTSSGGLGGSAANSIGSTKYSGGKGGNGSTIGDGSQGTAGAGGGGAGSTSNGGNGEDGTTGGLQLGGAGGTEYGGAGGNNTGSNVQGGNPGKVYGGGGSGARRISGGHEGGAGAGGQIRIRYTTYDLSEEYVRVLNYANENNIVKPSGSQWILHDNLWRTIKTGLGPSGMAKIRRFYMPANNGSSEFGTINWIDPTIKRAIPTNTPVWVSNRGWIGNRAGSRYVRIPFAMTEISNIKFNFSVIAYASAINQLITDGVLFGFQSGGIIYLVRAKASDYLGCHFNVTNSSAGSHPRGGMYHNRNLTNDMALFKNNSKFGHVVAPGNDPANASDFGFLCNWSNGAFTIDEDEYGSFLIISEALTDAEHTVIYNAFETYRAAIGLT